VRVSGGTGDGRAAPAHTVHSNRVFFTNSGAEAIEAALELVAFFIVHGCVSGVEARTLAVAWPPDLVLLEAPA